MYTRSWSRLYGSGSVGQAGFVGEFGLWDAEQAAAAEQIEASLGELDLVRLVFCDTHGLARSKTLTADSFRSVLRNGMDFSPGPFLFDTGHAVSVDFLADPGIGVDEIQGAGDFVVVPDPLTFQLIETGEARTAWVLGDEFLRDGARHPLSSRNVLRGVCQEYAARRMAPVIGLEVEWYLTRRLAGPPGNAGNGFGSQGSAPSVEAMNSGYQFNLDTAYDSVAEVADPLAMRLLELGLPLRSMEHESGPGQLETTFNPMLAMDAADAMLFFRTMVKQSCARRGFHASFMSLPRIDGFDPSGWHIHQSVVDLDSGRSLFGQANGSDGISTAGLAYIQGLLARARGFCLFSVPSVNGYRRLSPDFTLAPTRVGWSFEDRSTMVRVLGSGDGTHVEHRIGEPSANPYLAMASQLYAGLHGMIDEQPKGQLSPDPAPVHSLPASLREALELFEAEGAHDLLGKPLAACLMKVKQSEVSRFEAWCAQHSPDEGVTEWEQREYFETY